MKRFRLFAAFSHLSRAAKKQEGEERETGAETQDDASMPEPARLSRKASVHALLALRPARAVAKHLNPPPARVALSHSAGLGHQQT